MAGSWDTANLRGGKAWFGKSRKISIEFTADSGDASVPNQDVDDIEQGYLVSARVVFDGETPPDQVDLIVADTDGIDLLGGNGANFTASGKVDLSPPVPFYGALTVNVTGNTTNSAKAKIILYVI